MIYNLQRNLKNYIRLVIFHKHKYSDKTYNKFKKVFNNKNIAHSTAYNYDDIINIGLDIELLNTYPESIENTIEKALKLIKIIHTY